MGGTDNVFGAVDYAVFTVMLLVSALIGVYYRFTGDRQRTAREYLVANKNMSVVPVSFSLMASFMSAVTLLGVPSENYFYGTQFLLINVAYVFGTPFAAYMFLPVFYKMQIVSVYEYLEKRFGRATRLAASATFVIQMVFYMAVVLYAPAVALSAVTGISKWLSIISVGLVCTFYCTIGGMKAVLWTDLFQSLLMYIAMIAVVVVGTYNLGGLDKVWQEAQEGGRIEFFNFDPDPTVRHTVWTLSVGGIFVYVSLYGVNQAQVQRLMTVSSLRKAQVALFINWPLVSALSIVTSFTGLVMYANFRHCDPLKACRISKQDQVLPHFVMVYLGHVQGLPGLFVAGIFSGALSTVSSAVNSLAAVMLEDFVRPFCISPKTYDTHASLIVKVLAFFFGILCVLLTGVVEQLGGVLQASFIIFGVVGGPLLGLFTLGIFSSRTNQAGALAGLFAGLIVGFWVGFGAVIYVGQPTVLPLLVDGCDRSGNSTWALVNACMLSNVTGADATAASTVSDNITTGAVPTYVLPLYRLSYQWYSGFGWLVVVVVGLLVSLLTGGTDAVDRDHLSPVYLWMIGATNGKSRSWTLGRVRNSSVTSSQV
ncbi:unnamed protein product, partial [Ixodes pacificus]